MFLEHLSSVITFSPWCGIQEVSSFPMIYSASLLKGKLLLDSTYLLSFLLSFIVTQIQFPQDFPSDCGLLPWLVYILWCLVG